MADRVGGELDRHYKASAFQGDDGLVFGHPITGAPLDRHEVSRRFKAALKRARVREVRFHDLRHTFVVHRMTLLYRQGINPQGHLPYLAAYLGHRDIHSTLVYLTITQELLQRVNERFRTAETEVLRVIQGE